MDPLSTVGKTYEIHGNVCATREQFFARLQEVLSGRKTKLLGAILKPWYPLHKNIQFIGDFVRHYPNMQLNTHECVMQTAVDMYHGKERFERDGILTLADLDIVPEDYMYWETRTLEPYYDRLVPRMEQIEMRRKEIGYDGPVPSTPYISWHQASIYGYRILVLNIQVYHKMNV